MIPESDWRTFKEIHEMALERFCEKILTECRNLCQDEVSSSHSRYLALYDFVHQRYKEMRRVFDPFSRSTALFSLAQMWQMELITPGELNRFRPETREWVMRVSNYSL